MYHGETALLELSDEELDQALQFTTTIDDKRIPTYTGMLLIGRRDKLKALIPTAESRFPNAARNRASNQRILLSPALGLNRTDYQLYQCAQS